MERWTCSFTVMLFILIFSFGAVAQVPVGGPDLYSANLIDSLTQQSLKSPDGCYYNESILPVKIGTKFMLRVHGSKKEGKEIAVILTDRSGHTVKLTSKSLSSDFKSGIIHIDTEFYQKDTISLRITSLVPGLGFRYTLQSFFAGPETFYYKKDADMCWRLIYFLKHSVNGFNFLVEMPYLYKNVNVNTKSTISPFFPDNPNGSKIYHGDKIFYLATIGQGDRQKVLDVYNQYDTLIRQCLGRTFEMTETSDGNEGKILTATYFASKEESKVFIWNKDPNSIIKKDDKMSKYRITMVMGLGKYIDDDDNLQTIWELDLKFENLFFQYFD